MSARARSSRPTTTTSVGRRAAASSCFTPGLNASSDITDRLRAGVQLFSRDEGLYRDYSPTIDWAFLDYHWRDWLGVRAGRIKIPFGLSNEYADIDPARVQILLPQSVYPIGNREVLLSQTGFSLYGTASLHAAGALDYQAYGGTLFVPLAAVTSRAAVQTYEVDDKYIVGGQVFYRPPIDGLRIGASVLRTSIEFYNDLDPATKAALIAGKLVPPTFNGQVQFSYRPAEFSIASAEYTRGNWQFSAEYSRWYARVVWSLPNLLPTSESHAERSYGMATYRLSDRIEAGAYYSLFYPNVHDREGHGAQFKERFYAWQRDAAASLRFDVNDRWLWKAEAHFIDGVASLFDGAILDPTLNASPTRYWGMFLVSTTVTF